MWTLAASVSAQYQSTGDELYNSTRRALEALDSKTPHPRARDTEQVQAWLLLALHEFTFDFRRSWTSAGRAFRLIQLNWLQYSLGPDLPGDNNPSTEWVAAEEQRCTFWVAYCLDRFISIRIGTPATFSELVC